MLNYQLPRVLFILRSTSATSSISSLLFTFTVQVYFLFPTFAVIFAVPFFLAVILPLELTVATDFLFGTQTIENYKSNVLKNRQETNNSNFAENIKVEETEEQKLLNLQKLIREKEISEKDLSPKEKENLRNLYNSQIESLRKSILEKRNKIMKIKYEQKRKTHASV